MDYRISILFLLCFEASSSSSFVNEKAVGLLKLRLELKKPPYPCPFHREEVFPYFRTKKALEAHCREEHADKKTFFCSYSGCNACFVRSTELSRHKKRNKHSTRLSALAASNDSGRTAHSKPCAIAPRPESPPLSLRFFYEEEPPTAEALIADPNLNPIPYNPFRTFNK